MVIVTTQHVGNKSSFRTPDHREHLRRYLDLAWSLVAFHGVRFANDRLGFGDLVWPGLAYLEAQGGAWIESCTCGAGANCTRPGKHPLGPRYRDRADKRQVDEWLDL